MIAVWFERLDQGEVCVLAARLFASMVLLILCSALGNTADRAPGSGVLGVILAESGADTSLRDVLAGSFAVQLTLRKAVLHFMTPAGVPGFTVPRGLSEAAAQNAEYLIVGTYSTTDTECNLRVDLYNVSSGQKIRSAQSSGRIDLSMDLIVAQALEKTLSGVRFHEAAGSAPAETPQEAIPKPIPPASGASSSAVSQPQGAIAARGPIARKLLAIESGVAPLIVTGPAADYAKIGLLATLALGLRFPIAAGTFQGGVLTGVCWLGATGAVSSADVLMVPIGLDLQYLLNEGAFPGVTLHVSGGPALVSVNAAYVGNVSKIVPYLLAGMTLDLPFAAFVGLALEARYVAFFESSLTIMAFAPEVSVYVRF
jgi:hypothetical protein